VFLVGIDSLPKCYSGNFSSKRKHFLSPIRAPSYSTIPLVFGPTTSPGILYIYLGHKIKISVKTQISRSIYIYLVYLGPGATGY
jgi:hypothetical protein